MARIDLPEGDGLDVAKALMLAPHFVDIVVGYEKAIAASPMDPRLHELVRYRIAQINQCTLCLDFRREDSGLTEDLLALVGTDSEVFTPAERTALAYAEQFSLSSAAISDDLLAELASHFTPAEIVDLTLVIGKYVAMGRFMQVLGLDQTCAVDLARL